MPQDKARELEHAKKILHDPEFFWNSATPAGRKGSLRRAHWVMEAAGFRPGLDALEVGCGTGFFSEVFIPTGVKLRGIDISPDLLEKARQRCGAKADFLVADVEALPFADASFDAAVGIRVLHHLDMEPAFREITRVLRPGGVIAFCEPNMLNPQILVQKNVPFIKKAMGDTPDETAFFKWPLRKFLARFGYQDITIEPFDFLHPWVPAPVAEPVDRLGRWLERTPLVREIAGSLKIFARKPKKL